MKHRILYTLLAWCVSFGLVSAQGRSVSGKVTDSANGEGLPGVSVYLKGTTNGVATDVDGKYQLTVPNPAGDILIFSLVGYKNQEITLTADAEVNASLVSDNILDEVVVTAMGIEKQKKSLGISVTELKTADIQNTRSTNMVNSLSGRVAGVRVQGANGMVGSSSNIFIRGMTSFTQTNQPLFVVDGIPIDNTGGGNALQTGVSNSNRAIDINPDDIESMSVLKGPAAAVLYGSRAAAGAIMITTKKGKAGKIKIDYTLSHQSATPTRIPEYQNNYGQGNTNGVYLSNSILSWGPRFGSINSVTNAYGAQELYQAYPDNVESLFRKGDNTQNNIALSGGSEKGSFMVNYSNTIENGFLENNRLHRNTFKINLTQQLAPKITASVSANYFTTYSKRTQQGNQLSNPFFRAWFMPRSINPHNIPLNNPNTGAPNFWPSNGEDNPIWSMRNVRWNDQVDRLLGNISLTYDIFDWMSVTYKLGTDYSNQNINMYDGFGIRGQGNLGATTVGGGGIGKASTQTSLTSSYLNLNFKKKFNDDFEITGLVGQEINVNQTSFTFGRGFGIGIDNYDNLANVTTFTPTNGSTETRLMGIYADIQGSFRNFLFLNLTGRNDRSSTFGRENRSYFYPSVSTSFVFTEAIEALKENAIISSGRVRANIAKVGRVAPAYSTDTYYSQAAPADGWGALITFPFQNRQGLSLNDAGGNAKLAPEFTTTREIGTELKFLKNRILLDLGYFSTNSTDIILNVPVASASGFTSVAMNAGKLNSKGIELLLSGTAIKKGGFSWDVSFNWTRIRNFVKELAPGVTSIGLGGFGGNGPQTRLEANSPYGVIYGTKFIRHTDGKLILNANGQPIINSALGMGLIGDPNPDWTAGLTNTFSYKGISLSFLLDIRKGGDILSRNIGDLRRSGAANETGDRDRGYVIEGWKGSQTGVILTDAGGSPMANDIQTKAEQFWGSMFAFGTGESYVFDASWIRLRELSITYDLPKNLLSKAKLSNVQIGVSGRNLMLWAPNVPHIDPEVNAQGVSNSQGFEYNGLPQSRTMGFMLRITY